MKITTFIYETRRTWRGILPGDSRQGLVLDVMETYGSESGNICLHYLKAKKYE